MRSSRLQLHFLPEAILFLFLTKMELRKLLAFLPLPTREGRFLLRSPIFTSFS